MKKIYFCGSIRGGRNDVSLYQDLIRFMKEKGFRVLTEHIASPEVFGLEVKKTDHEIWLEDMSWLNESDFVIAECSTPSLGVGYELAVAKHLKKPTFVFARRTEREHSLSAMIAGDPYYNVRMYSDDAEILAELEKVLSAEGV